MLQLAGPPVNVQVASWQIWTEIWPVWSSSEVGQHQKFTGITTVFCWLPAVGFMRNSMSFMRQKLHDFDDSVDVSAQPWGSSPRRNRTGNLPLLCFQIHLRMSKFNLASGAWDGLLHYRWELMWTLTIPKLLALSINSIVLYQFHLVNIQNSDVFTYRFWAVKARSVFLS